MTEHRSASARSRRRRSGPAHGSGRRGGKGPLWGGLAALTVLGAVGLAAAEWTSSGAGGSHGDARTEPTVQAGTGPATSRPTHAAKPAPSASPRSPAPSGSPSASAPDIPSTGPGTFTAASGGSAKVGTGTPLRYRVEVEDGLDLSAADVARQVEAVLADRRGWTADGRSAFQRVSGGTADFVVRVATPGTVDEICGQYGLNTGGEVNCNVSDNVMVNLKRWLLATPVYAKDVPAYRALIINHEVGHFLGHGHVGCPGQGQPAPAMMQQIKGMNGCVPNVWPYDDRGRYVTGPAVP
ncbi:DUF3152 domain-containing protein [Streptomyces sp. ALI-76-A]|uniref:DUF3152 domain-containing protein n=1 Tax=Streptomyces sp. ALI-76-A TaxID=3025736 RepID=UPI00256EFEE8|nr:DUF3152 domain-containing protein [Streptomyces sp. ALI-76-A]MDL5204471.1 DUF3152 domain-containing protein [Streptomyces sp. ALI-76-A]